MPRATGKYSMSISDRSGQAFPYREMVKEWTGALVHISEYEPKHPQLDPPYTKADGVALRNARPQDFQQPTVVNGEISSSGGNGMITANLTLPGDFAFLSNGMKPLDPSLQNRNRHLTTSLGSITVEIS